MTDGKFVVGVIGTQNTGKSTFINDLICKYKNTPNEFKTVGCDYRKKVEEAGLKINRDGNLECQKIICDTLIEQLDIIDKMPAGNYITDRSPLDSYVYTVYLFRHKPELGITTHDLDEMYNKVKTSMMRYDRIIYIVLENCNNVAVVDDRFRDTNLEYREEINQIFYNTICSFDSEWISRVVNTKIYGTREDRVKKFEEMESKYFSVKQ